jgi:tetratricopeptide (TPR) repeat protein
VAIIGNVARGYSNLGRNDLALAYLQRAQRIQPNAPTVRSLEVVLLARTGEEQRAMERARQAEAEGHVDMDLINTHLLLASRARDFATVQKLLEERIERWPETRAASHVQLGLLYAREFKDDAKALAFFRQGLAEATPPERPALLQQVPPELRAALAGAAAPQTSANSR